MKSEFYSLAARNGNGSNSNKFLEPQLYKGGFGTSSFSSSETCMSFLAQFRLISSRFRFQLLYTALFIINFYISLLNNHTKYL